MKFAAFFRNLNLGRPPAPSREVFEAAFLAAGAKSAASFQVNGTIAFEASSERQAASLLAKACKQLRASCQFEEPAFCRPMQRLAQLVEQAPFEHVDASKAYGCYITFLHADAQLPTPRPMANARGDLKVIEYTGAEMLSVAYQFGASPGSPNVFAERMTELPATTRGWGTVLRLVAKHA